MTNVQQQSLENASRTEKYSGSVAKNIVSQLNLNQLATQREREKMRGGGSGAPGRPMNAKQHRNDVLNYKYKAQIDDAREQNRHSRNIEAANTGHRLIEKSANNSAKRAAALAEHKHILQESSADNKLKRETTLNKAKLGNVINGVHDIQNRFGGVPVSIRHDGTDINFGSAHPGYGNGAQGQSKQQSQPGGKNAQTDAKFDEVMPPFSVKGEGGKRAPNPAYQDWRQKKDSFNAEATSGNVPAPISLAKRPGQKPVVNKRAKSVSE